MFAVKEHCKMLAVQLGSSAGVMEITLAWVLCNSYVCAFPLKMNKFGL